MLYSLVAAATTTSTVPEVELITMGPGPELYSYWGHAALLVRDPVAETEVVYNFGSVDFSDGFFLRMLRGQVDAFIGVSSYRRTEAAYVGEGRTFERRRLAIGAAEARALADHLAQHHGPKATYRYHHFLDNCSTRVAQLIDHATRGRLADRTPLAPPATFRTRALEQLAPHPFTAAAVDLAIAHGVDVPIDHQAATFLPDELARQVDRIPGLVERRTTVFQAPPVEAHRPWVVVALACTAPLLLLTARRPRAASWIYGWGAGLIGLALLILWLFTTYDFVARNLNALVLPPTHLALPFLGPTRRRAYLALHGVVLVALLVVHLLGGLSQDIGGPLSFALPVGLGLLTRLSLEKPRVTTSTE